MLPAGDHGPVLVAGDPASSLLVQKTNTQCPVPAEVGGSPMPIRVEGAFTEDEQWLLYQWVAEGGATEACALP